MVRYLVLVVLLHNGGFFGFSQESNPFDIDRNRSKINNEVHSTLNGKPIYVETIDMNPFEVSHEIQIVPSKIKSHNTQINQLSTKKEIDTKQLTFWLMLLCVVFMAVIVQVNRSIYSKIFRSIFNWNLIVTLRQENNSGFSLIFTLLYVSFFISVGLFLYLVNTHIFYNTGNWKILGLCFLGLFTFFIIKHLVLTILGFIFPISNEIGVYNFSIALFNIILGLVMIPMNLLISFSPYSIMNLLIYLVCIIAIILLIFRTISGINMSRKHLTYAPFQFFIYLCTVEIIPVLLVVKMIT